MPFGRLHEEAAGDDKLTALSNAAWRMWGMGLIYCQKNLTDGFIPAGAIHLWHVRGGQIARVAEELCAPQVPGKAALWAHVEGGYHVHDYLQWNDSKVEIVKMRAEAKDRIARFRERERQDREALAQRVRNAEQEGVTNGARNALPNAFQNAHDVVRGSLREEKGDHTPARASGRSDGALAGSLPKDHKHHAVCDDTFSRCVPQAVHDKLANLLAPKHNGDRVAASAALKAWYRTVWASLADDDVIPDNAFKFWGGRFDAAFASPATPTDRRQAVPTVDASRERQRRMREDAS